MHELGARAQIVCLEAKYFGDMTMTSKNTLLKRSFYTNVSEAWKRDGPYRSPDWRYRRSRALFEDGKLPSPRLYDATVRRLTEFYALRQECNAPTQHMRLRERMPHVFDAVLIAEATRPGIRHVIESMILADEEPSRIGKRMGLSESAISFYEAALYDIRPRLHLRDFVTSVIDSSSPSDDDRTQMVRTMKTFCYFAGVQALDVFTLAANDPDTWQRPEELMSTLARRSEAVHQLQLATDPKNAGRNDAQALETLKKIEEQWTKCWAEVDWITSRTSRHEARMRESVRDFCRRHGSVLWNTSR